MGAESAQTRCPACQTVFAVAKEDLERAGGRVRCGDCLIVFDALANLVGERAASITPAAALDDELADSIIGQRLDDDAVASRERDEEPDAAFEAHTTSTTEPRSQEDHTGSAETALPADASDQPATATTIAMPVLAAEESAVDETDSNDLARADDPPAHGAPDLDDVAASDDFDHAKNDDVDLTLAAESEDTAAESEDATVESLPDEADAPIDEPASPAIIAPEPELPAEDTAGAQDGASAPVADSSPSGSAFRFGDDTPDDTLQAELDALLAEETPAPASPPATEPIAAEVAVAESSQHISAETDILIDDEGVDDEDWDDLLAELADQVADAGSAASDASLDFELVDDDAIGQQASVDLDLTRAEHGAGDAGDFPDVFDAPEADGGSASETDLQAANADLPETVDTNTDLVGDGDAATDPQPATTDETNQQAQAPAAQSTPASAEYEAEGANEIASSETVQTIADTPSSDVSILPTDTEDQVADDGVEFDALAVTNFFEASEVLNDDQPDKTAPVTDEGDSDTESAHMAVTPDDADTTDSTPEETRLEDQAEAAQAPEADPLANAPDQPDTLDESLAESAVLADIETASLLDDGAAAIETVPEAEPAQPDTAIDQGGVANHDDHSDDPEPLEVTTHAPIKNNWLVEDANEVAGLGQDALAAAMENEGEVIVLSSDEPLPDNETSGLQSDDAFAESMILGGGVVIGRPRRRLWMGLSLAAAVLLAIQLIHSNRGVLATSPRLGGAITEAYSLLGMPVTPQWDVTQLCVERSGALATENLLEIESVFSNQGDIPLPLPLLKVRITDVYSDTLASQVIEPADYLRIGTPVDAVLAPGERTTALATLDFAEPRLDRYEFSVCYSNADGQLRCAGSCPSQ
ncbi:MAG: DUF3426 domain-containing protein [Pseudomonadota bacterium]